MAQSTTFPTKIRKQLFKIVMNSLRFRYSKSSHLVSCFTQMSDFLNRGWPDFCKSFYQ